LEQGTLATFLSSQWSYRFKAAARWREIKIVGRVFLFSLLFINLYDKGQLNLERMWKSSEKGIVL